MPSSMPMLTVIIEVIRHTPSWVWAILATLIVLGGLQLREHRPARLRVALQPLGLGAYSMWGAASLFGTHASVLAAWALGMVLAAFFTRQWPWSSGVRHDADSNRFHVPGSAWPLLLMLTVFAVRYSVVVTLVFHPDWAGHTALAMGVSALYGSLSGLFAGRALHILGHGPRAAAVATA
jgi:hypothetical protein